MRSDSNFQPGSIVTARGREWIVLPRSRGDRLHLRPMGASEQGATVLHVPLEREPVTQASFPLPDPQRAGTRAGAELLRDALMLKLRSGAGPFRSFGNISFEPRAYQLVPLLMALKQDRVRLLIADDVGIGKTIEAGLIVRELMDRGELDRFTVLCPPHLCEQWQRELADRFHLHAEVVRTATAARLERGLPPATSIFDAYPVTIVSLDYIKSDRRRDEFFRACPDCVVVDEAHTCTTPADAQGVGGSMRSRHQRYRLLKGLAEGADRHLILLTATPHSGDEAAFFNLLGLLHPDFVSLKDLPPDARAPLRQRLGEHLCQRRRPDIAEWHDSQLFPTRYSAETTYRFSNAWKALLDDVLDYARELVEAGERAGRLQQRINWWSALALLRCISSSPAAAVNALRTRLARTIASAADPAREAESDSEQARLDQVERMGLDRVLDGTEDALSTEDIEPPARTEDDPRLEALLVRANALRGPKQDPKLAALIDRVKALRADGFKPVIFCRYIATAHYLADALAQAFRQATVAAITGELTPGEREEQVAALADEAQPILVATDCLSEGINLQDGFTAVVHYDLSWNPTRHEQREGRVDRFGQQAREVRTLMLYGEDNPVDGAVLKVILRKAETIRKELGVMVPMPDDEAHITQALMNAVLLHRRDGADAQLALEFGAGEQDVEQALDTAWRNASERIARNTSIFAQRRLKPEDVLPDWRRTLAALGDDAAVERFVRRTAQRLGASPRPEGSESSDGDVEAPRSWRFPLQHLPGPLVDRYAAGGLEGVQHICFRRLAGTRARFVHRTHPLVSLLADHVLETALQQTPAALTESDTVAVRSAALFTTAVHSLTTVWLLRVRNQISVTRRIGNTEQERTLLAEETLTLVEDGAAADATPFRAEPDRVEQLLAAEPAANMADGLRARHVRNALQRLPELLPVFEREAVALADTLLEDHRRVRRASDATGRYRVAPILPVDVIGVYVLVPRQ